MPIFLVYAHDHVNGIERRMAARSAHIALGDKLVAEGRLVFGAAIMNDDGMAGSVLIGNFPDREALDAWLAVEPYIVENVWESWSVEEIKVGPSFTNALPNLT